MINPALTDALLHLGLPPVRDARPLGTRGGVQDTLLLFGDGPDGDTVVLRQVVDGWGEVRLERELAAFAAMEGSGLPTPKGYRILRTLAAPAAIFPAFRGSTGRAVLERRPDLAPVVFGALGRVMCQLAAIALPMGGHAAARKGFLPSAPSPGAEWLREARHHHRVAAANGTALGGIGSDLVAAVADAVDAVDAIETIALVHRGFDAHAILLAPRPDGDVDITGVYDFGDAIAGDPLGEWAPALFAPIDRVALTVRGFGPEAEATLSHPTAHRRLRAYAAATCLANLAAVDRVGGRRARAVQHLRHGADDLLSDRFVERRVEAILDAVPHPRPGPPTRAPLGPSVTWRALDLVRLPDAVHGGDVVTWLAALATTALGDDLAPRGHRILDAIRVTGRPILGVPPVDPEWPAAWASRCLVAAAATHSWAGVIVTGLALGALDDVGDAVDPAMCDGLDRLAVQLEAVGEQAMSNRDLFLHALVARALVGVVQQAADDDTAEVVAALDHSIEEGWYAIEPMVPSTRTAAWQQTVDALARGTWDHLDLGGWVPLALLAIRALHDRLPAPAEEVLYALGLSPLDESP